MSVTKKDALIHFLEKRRIVSFDEIVQLLDSVNTAKHYIMELRRAGVLKYRDVVTVKGKQATVYFVSHKGLEAYKEELRRRRQKKVELIQRINERKRKRLSEDAL